MPIRILFCVLIFSLTTFAQQGYQKPPKAVQDVLNATCTCDGFDQSGARQNAIAGE